jgi:hypothetical protein
MAVACCGRDGQVRRALSSHLPGMYREGGMMMMMLMMGVMADSSERIIFF